MKLLFKESQLSILKQNVLDNPTATGVELTEAELIAIYDEFITAKDSNCVMISGKDRHVYLYGRWLEVKIKL